MPDNSDRSTELNNQADLAVPPDISSKKLACDMADASLRTAVDAIITINERGTIKNLNPATETLFGYSRNELLGHNVSMLAPEPERSAHDSFIQRYLDTGEKRIIGIGRDVEGQHRDGHRFPIHLSVSEFRTEGKRYFTGVIHDLTARRKIEDELRQSRALFQSIFNHLPDAMVLTDADGIISLCNPATEKIFGYQPNEMSGQSLRILYADEKEFERRRATMIGAMEGTETDPVTITARHKSGRQFPAELVCSPVHDGSGGHLGFLGLLRDISEEQKREASLRQSQRLEAVGQLTGGIAHDFNNLLTVITGNHELLEMRLKDQKNRDLLRRANEAAQMAVRLIGRLLAFSKRSQLEPAVVQLNELVLNTLEVLRRSLGEGIELQSRLSPDLWQTRADPSEIENAVLNLAINARDAMNSGAQSDGCLTIETKNTTIEPVAQKASQHPTPGQYVLLSVRDNGHGMEPEVLARVFEPFFTTKQTGRGTGLGLSTIYGFVQQSGGHIAIDSAPGKGTTVDLYLPRYDAAGSAEQETAKPENAAPRSKGRILVVEDNREVRDLTLERLKQLGFQALATENGVAALKMLEKDRDFDLVFSDVVMPGGVSGIDVAKWVKGNRPELKILLTSGYADTPGKGTTVDLYLPRYDAAGSAEQETAKPENAAPRSKGRILVVEDNREVRDLTLERLKQLGFQALATENGVAALKMLEKDRDFDLVFSDVVMPGGVSGIDVAKWVKGNRPELKILLTSGYADELARGRSEFGDAFPVLRKPYERAQLAQAISNCLAEK